MSNKTNKSKNPVKPPPNPRPHNPDLTNYHDKEHCPACGVSWKRHSSKGDMCEHLERCLNEIRRIHVWATRYSRFSLTPHNVAEACEIALGPAPILFRENKHVKKNRRKGAGAKKGRKG